VVTGAYSDSIAALLRDSRATGYGAASLFAAS